MKKLWVWGIFCIGFVTSLAVAQTNQKLDLFLLRGKALSAFSSPPLNTASDGSVTYCTDCTPGTNPCTGSGSGSQAIRIGGTWACPTILDTGGVGGESDSFVTQNTPLGTDPVAESSADTLNFVGVGPLVITGDALTDTLTFSLDDATTIAKGIVELAGDNESAASLVVQANDTRLSNARTPTVHATSHQNGGADEIGAATAGANAIPKAGAGGTLADGWLPATFTRDAELDSFGEWLIFTGVTGTPDGTKFLRDDGTLQTIPGGGDALVANPLSQFAATTSDQLATVLSNESGTAGGFARVGSPTDDSLPLANGTDWQTKTFPDCDDSGGNHLNYDTTTNALSCGTSGDGSGSGSPGGSATEVQYNNTTFAGDAGFTYNATDDVVTSSGGLSSATVLSAKGLSGANLGAKIASGLTALASSGGTIDSSTMTGAQAITSSITVSQSNITLKFPCNISIAWSAGVQLIITGANVTVEGCGDSTFFDATAGTGSNPPILVSGGGADNVTLRNFRIDGNRTAGGTAHAIQQLASTGAADNFTLQNVTINNAGGHGFLGEGATNTRILDNRVNTPTNSGIRWSGDITYFWVLRNTVNGDASGVSADAAIGPTCTTTPCASHGEIAFNRVFNAGVNGIGVGSTVASPATHIDMHDNFVDTVGLAGADGECMDAGASFSQTHHNILRNCFGHGLQIFGSVTDSQIFANQITNVSLDPSGNVQHCVGIVYGTGGSTYDAARITISDNTCMDDQGTPTSPYAVTLENFSTSGLGTITDIIINDNVAYNMLNSPRSRCVNLNGTPACTGDPEVVFASHTVPGGAPLWCDDTAVATDAYSCIVTPVLTAATLVEGTTLLIMPATDNTGAATVDVDGAGPIAAGTIVAPNGSTLLDGVMAAGRRYWIVRTGANYILQGAFYAQTTSGLGQFTAPTSSATLFSIINNETGGAGLLVGNDAPTIATPNLTGKIDFNNVAVSDDDCDGEQGKGWYDSTDSQWEMCNDNSGVPTVMSGGGGGVSGLTTGTLPKAANATTLEDSAWSEDVDSVNSSKTIEGPASATPAIRLTDSNDTESPAPVTGEFGTNLTTTTTDAQVSDVWATQLRAGAPVDTWRSVGNGAFTIGNVGTTALTITTDSTGDAEVVLPAQSISGSEILNNTLGATQLADSLDLGGDTSFEIPNSAAPTTDAAGEIALDTTITDHQPLLQYFDGGENMTVIAIDTSQLPAQDNEIVKYDAATDKFVLEADAGSGVGCVTSGSNNQVVTDDGLTGCASEANLTFDGSVLAVTGNVTVSSEAYDATGWNADTSVPQKDAVRDQFEAEPAATRTLTNKTLDGSATGNIVKLKGYIYLTHPHLCDGTNATIGTTATAIGYGHATFSNSVDQASNYCEYYIQVPEDIDTSVALRGRIKVRLGGADTASQRYVLSTVSVADSAVATSSTLANAINVDFAGDASGASGDEETSAWTTLTSWAGALTAGQTWRIRFARDGDTSDASTVNSTEGGLVIEYSVTQ